MNKKFTLSRLWLCFLLALSCFSWSNSNAQCTPFYSSGCIFSNYISGVQLTNLNFSNTQSLCSVTNQPDTAKICAGSTDSMFVSIAASSHLGIGVFIDTNSNGFGASDFFYGVYDTMQLPTYKFTITIPATARPGVFKMRIFTASQYAPTSADSCFFDPGFGNYYDMWVRIIDSISITGQPQSVAGCIGGPVSFHVTNTGAGSTYQWFKNGVPVPGAVSSTLTLNPFKASDTAFYWASITNYCSVAQTDTTVALTIKTPPPVHVSASGPTSFCPGGRVGLTGNTGAGYTYKWLYSNGTTTVVTSDTTFTDTVGTPGTYTFIVSNGCPDTAAGVNIINYPISTPIVIPAGLNKVCATVPFTFSTPVGTGVRYQWQVNTGIPNLYVNIPNDTVASMVVNQTGFYRVIMTDSNNCVTTSLASTLQENSPAIVNIATLASPYLCAGGYITMTASSSDTGEKFRWQFNGQNIVPASSATGSTYNAFQPGNYSVVGNNGCAVTSASISIYGIPFPVVNVGGPTTFCGSGSVLLSSSVTSPLFTYQWLHNGVNIPGANATTYTVVASSNNDTGSYSVVLVSNNTCSAGSTPIEIKLLPLPTPVAIVGTDGITLTVTPYFLHYQWYKSGTLIPGATHASYMAHTSGYYSVAVTDDNGCTGTSAVVFAIGDVSVGNVPSPEQVSVYPNPATSVVHINAPFSVSISLTAIDGRVVLSQTDAKEINIQNLADGIYLMRIADENGNVIKIEKLVKSKQ